MQNSVVVFHAVAFSYKPFVVCLTHKETQAALPQLFLLKLKKHRGGENREALRAEAGSDQLNPELRECLG